MGCWLAVSRLPFTVLAVAASGPFPLFSVLRLPSFCGLVPFSFLFRLFLCSPLALLELLVIALIAPSFVPPNLTVPIPAAGGGTRGRQGSVSSQRRIFQGCAAPAHCFPTTPSCPFPLFRFSSFSVFHCVCVCFSFLFLVLPLKYAVRSTLYLSFARCVSRSSFSTLSCHSRAAFRCCDVAQPNMGATEYYCGVALPFGCPLPPPFFLLPLFSRLAGDACPFPPPNELKILPNAPPSS